MRYFSPSTGGFYTEETHGHRQIAAPQTKAEIKAGKRPKMVDNHDCAIPADAVPVSDARFAELMAAQADGASIVAAGKGPVAIERQPDPAEAEALRRRLRDRLLAESDWTQLGDTLAGDPQAKQAWVSYRQQLRDLDMGGSDWPAAPGVEQV